MRDMLGSRFYFLLDVVSKSAEDQHLWIWGFLVAFQGQIQVAVYNFSGLLDRKEESVCQQVVLSPGLPLKAKFT